MSYMTMDDFDPRVVCDFKIVNGKIYIQLIKDINKVYWCQPTWQLLSEKLHAERILQRHLYQRFPTLVKSPDVMPDHLLPSLDQLIALIKSILIGKLELYHYIIRGPFEERRRRTRKPICRLPSPLAL